MRFAQHNQRGPSRSTKHRGRLPTGVMLVLLTAATMTMSGCLAAAAAAGAGAGYAVGHEQGENHVQDGVHTDDD